MKKTLALLMASALMLSLAGCSQTGGSSSFGEAETCRIGNIQPMEHESLDAAREGFVQALADDGYTDGDTIVLDYQNAQVIPPHCSPSASGLWEMTATWCWLSAPVQPRALPPRPVRSLADHRRN
ncbi:MAG: ABC transporter substrate binding protein [Acutalibacteraceae bacterium]